MKFLRLGVLIIAIDLVAAQQPQPASIEGVVVTLGSGEPLAEATVQLDREIKAPDDPYGPRPGRGANRFAHTDQNGRFVFENIAPGEYRLIATRSGGYVPGEYGQRTATGTGMVVGIASGQRMTDVRLALSPTGSISGRVYDRNGEAAGKAQLQALQSVYKNGHKQLTIIQIVQSNDRGEYRLFWLPPGSYYDVAGKTDVTVALAPNVRGRFDLYRVRDDGFRQATFISIAFRPEVIKRSHGRTWRPTPGSIRISCEM